MMNQGNQPLIDAIVAMYPQVDDPCFIMIKVSADILAANPVSAHEILYEASRFEVGDIKSIYLFRKSKLLRLTPKEQRALVSKSLRYPSANLVTVPPSL